VRRLALEGKWYILAQDLISSVEKHKLDLRALMLYGVTLRGEWAAALAAIADATRGNLNYISVRDPAETSEVDDGFQVVQPDLRQFETEGLMCFDCATNFDDMTDDDESEDEHGSEYDTDGSLDKSDGEGEHSELDDNDTEVFA